MSYRILLFVSLFSAQLAPAENIPFTIPPRPLGSPERIKEINEHAVTEKTANQFRAEAMDECPATAFLYYKIKVRIEKANALRGFGPYKYIALVIKCWGLPTRFFGETAADGAIILDRRWVNLVKTEDEMAFVLAHEYAHLLLGHEETEDFSTQSEIDADRLGAILSANAGYNPVSTRQLFCSMERSYQHEPKSTPCKKLNRFDKDHGGTIDQRSRRIEDFLQSVHFEPPQMKTTRDLIKAKAEVACMDSGLSPKCTDVRVYIEEIQRKR